MHKAVVVVESGSANEARQRLGELSLVRAGMIEFQILLLAAHLGFEQLYRRT